MKSTLTVNREITLTKICLTGAMRSGKDEVANHLYIRHGFDRLAFGDALKRIAHEAFPWVSEHPKPRALYQNVGQLMREVDKDVWIRHAERRVGGIIDHRSGYPNVEHIGIVISDLRQPNEYAWAVENGFSIIRVNAPQELRVERANSVGDAFELNHLTHETESHIDGFDVDFEVVNDGTVTELQAHVDAIMEAI
jgi:dephospho-CoA kinase